MTLVADQNSVEYGQTMLAIMSAQANANAILHESWFDVLMPGQLQELSRKQMRAPWVGKVLRIALEALADESSKTHSVAISALTTKERLVYAKLLQLDLPRLRRLAEVIFWLWATVSLRTLLNLPKDKSLIVNYLPESFYLALLNTNPLSDTHQGVLNQYIGAKANIGCIDVQTFQCLAEQMLALVCNIWPAGLGIFIKIRCDYHTINFTEYSVAEHLPGLGFICELLLDSSFNKLLSFYETLGGVATDDA